jgi:hypothetical protein
MRFLMLIRALEGGEFLDPEPWLAKAGDRRLEGGPLAHSENATTVREGGRLITDGPFAETSEQIAGYDLLECADLDEAVMLAAAHPVAAVGAIEVRPLWTE